MPANEHDIIYLAQGSPKGTVFDYDPRQSRFRQGVLEACASHGLSCDYVGIHKAPNGPSPLGFRRPRRGFLLWSNRLPSVNLVLDHLVRSGLPVAEYDETASKSILGRDHATFPASVPRLTLTVPGRSSGQAMARHLFAKGHRHLAYVSPYHPNGWSKDRFEGVRQACAVAGPEYSVHAYLPVAQGWGATQEEHADPHIAFFPVLPALSGKSLRQQGSEGLDQDMLRQLNMYLNEIAQREDMQLMLLPAFRAALQEEAITAWVCANDFVALQALVFLRRQSIPCPQRIAVMGYDDIPEAEEAGLTSFDLGLEEAATHLIEFLASPSPQSGWICRESDGVPVPRLST